MGDGHDTLVDANAAPRRVGPAQLADLEVAVLPQRCLERGMAQDREDLALFISASMEGMTVFAGHEKPFEPRMTALERIAIQSFIAIVRNFRPKGIGAAPRAVQGGASA